MRRASDVPRLYNAVDIVERNLALRSDKVALLSPDRTMTFAEVAREVDRVGRGLLRLGVRIGDAVGILAPDCAEWATAFFGVIKVGAVAVSLKTMITPAECIYMLADCRARVVIVHRSLLEAVEAVRDRLPLLEHVVVIGEGAVGGPHLAWRDWVGAEPEDLRAAPTHRDDICMLNYSSGTTGEPKGIPHAHKDLPLSSQLYAVDAIGMRDDDRNCGGGKLYFTYCAGGNLIYAWYAGASVVLNPVSFRDAGNLLATIDRFRPTILHGVPTNYASMLAVEGFAERYDLSSLRMCVSAGEALPVAVWREWRQRTGLEIVEGIGTTENLALFLTNRPGDLRPGSTGKPVGGYEIRIVDDEGGPVRPGQVGTLMVKGETAALCYLHQYERSRQTFRGEWLCTGDRYRVDADGFHWFVGRADDMLKVGGIWVSPLEIENTLAAHGAVLECAVVGQPDRSGLVKPKAFVVLRPGHLPSDGLAGELIAHCTAEMAPYKRPRWVEFVDRLPRTATDKLLRSKGGDAGDAGTAPP